MKIEETSKRLEIGAPASGTACSIGAPSTVSACFDSRAIRHPQSSILNLRFYAGEATLPHRLAASPGRTASFYPMPARGLRCNRPAQTQNSDSGNIWPYLVTLSHFRSGFGQVLVKFCKPGSADWSRNAGPYRRMVFGISSPVK